MSEGPGRVQRNGACPGWSWATHRASPSVGRFAWTWGWRRRRVVGVWTRAHKHGGHGWHDVEAVEPAVTARQRWAGQQFFRRGVAHTRPPGHVSGPKKKSISLNRNTWHLDRVPAAFLTMPLPSPFAHLPSRRPPAVGRVPAAFHTSALKVRAAQPTHPHTDCAPTLSVRPPAKLPSTRCGTRPGRLPHVRAQGTCCPAHSPTH